MRITVKTDRRAADRLRRSVAARYRVAQKEADQDPCDQWVVLSPWGERVSRTAIESCGGSRIGVAVTRPFITLEGRRGSFADLPWPSTGLDVTEALLGALLGAEVLVYESAQPWRRINVAGVWLVPCREDSILSPRHAGEEDGPLVWAGCGRTLLRLGRQDWPGREVTGNCLACGATLSQDATWHEGTDDGRVPIGWRCPSCVASPEDIAAVLSTAG